MDYPEGLATLDAIGHVCYALLLAGQIQIAHKRRLGFMFRVVGQAGWIFLGFQLGMTSIWLWGFPFIANEFYGWWKWRRAET